MKLIFYLILFLFILTNTEAQTTAIPDQNFEQALIDMNIDSDGMVNGQVLTSDIDDVIELDFENVPINDYITDLTGIEDFAALEILDFHYFYLYLDPSQADILSNNINLREFIAMKPCGDCGGPEISSLDLSGLPNLELVDLSYGFIQSLKLNSPNYDLVNLNLDLYNDGVMDPGTYQICIEVDDPQAATNNDPPYDTWNINVNSTTTTYFFGANCVLSVDEHEALNTLSVYPNPVQDKLNIENPQEINLDEAGIFDMTGKKVKSFSSFDEAINIERLEQGVYFLKVVNKNKTKTFRIMKN